jgi:hypothetical protein
MLVRLSLDLQRPEALTLSRSLCSPLSLSWATRVSLGTGSLPRVLLALTSALVQLLGACALWGIAHAGQAELDAGWRWKAADETLGIEVYVRSRPDHHREFLAITRVQARLSTVAAVLQDTQAMPQWLYRTREVQVLESAGPASGLLRLVTHLPWPLADRDAVIAWQMKQDALSGEVQLNGAALKPLGGGMVEVRLSGYGHMGGNLSFPPLRAFVSTAVWQAPLESLRGLHGMVQRPAYRQAQVPAVREWP